MTQAKYYLPLLTLVLLTAGCGAEAEGEEFGSSEKLGTIQQAATFRCATPAVHFKQNPQPADCQNPTISNVNAFHFNFAAEDVAAQKVPVYFFDAGNGYLTVVKTLPNANSFHTEFTSSAITRAYYANAAGQTQEISVPGNMVGVHHGSSNNSVVSANWSGSGSQTQSVTIAQMHTCTYLRTR